MQHHAGLSNGFWIYAVKAKLHTYNVTPIKHTDYKTLKELWSGQKPNISHLRVFGCLAWVHIQKKRRHKLQSKSKAMIFVGYEPGSKGYQFWDAAHQCFKISHDVKFEETHFSAKESKLTQSIPAPLSNHQSPEPDNESDSSGLDLVTLAQPPAIPPLTILHWDQVPIVQGLQAPKHHRLQEDLTLPYQMQDLLRYHP